MGEDIRFTICRLCLRSEFNLTYVFETKGIQENALVDLLNELLRDEVFSDDKYPQSVCANCVEKLTDFKKFKDECTEHRKLFDHAYCIKNASSADISTQKITYQNLIQEELNLRALEVIAANITMIEPKEEVEDNESDDERLSCISEWEEIPQNALMEREASEELHDDPLSNERADIQNGAESMDAEEQGKRMSAENDPKCVTDYPSNDTKNKNNSFQCAECCQYFADEETVITHCKSHLTANSPELSSKDVTTPGISSECHTNRPELKFPQALGLFSCDICRRIFKSISQLEIHIKSHSGETEFACPVCPDRFHTKCTLHNHMKMMHSTCTEALYDCTDCGFKVSDIIDRETVNEAHESSSSSEEADIVAENAEHVSPNVPVFPECKTTELQFQAYGEMAGGKKRKNGPFLCLACGKTYKLLKFYTKHVTKHTERKLYKCRHCEKTFKTQSKYTTHLHVHRSKEYVCKECGIVYKNVELYKRHVLIHGERNFKCDVCNKAYFRKNDLVQHKNVHKKGETLICDICGKVYDTWILFRRHKYRHRVIKEGKYNCKQCPCEFSCAYDLKLHMRRHETRTFYCPLCKENLPTKMSLQYHMQRHENGLDTRLLYCEQCGKHFATAGTLERHKKLSHLDLKLFKCEKCPKEYSQKHNLDYHIKNKHS